MTDGIVCIHSGLTRSELKRLMYDLLYRKYGRPKALGMSLTMIDVLESKLGRPRENYLIDMKANTNTGEVYLHVESKYSHANIEANMLVKSLKYTRWCSWFDYKLSVR